MEPSAQLCQHLEISERRKIHQRREIGDLETGGERAPLCAGETQWELLQLSVGGEGVVLREWQRRR